jgi:hypothetical protein
VAYERLTLRPQQLSPLRERWATVFTTPVPVPAIMDGFRALARLKWRRGDNPPMHPGRLRAAARARTTAPLER